MQLRNNAAQISLALVIILAFFQFSCLRDANSPELETIIVGEALADLGDICEIPAYDRLTAPHRSKEVSDIIKSARETDNPIIMIVDLK